MRRELIHITKVCGRPRTEARGLGAELQQRQQCILKSLESFIDYGNSTFTLHQRQRLAGKSPRLVCKVASSDMPLRCDRVARYKANRRRARDSSPAARPHSGPRPPIISLFFLPSQPKLLSTSTIHLFVPTLCTICSIQLL